jgi:hypothetical protein
MGAADVLMRLDDLVYRVPTTAPTRICMVCECKENPEAEIAYSDKAWLCEKCKKALQKLVLQQDD